jgi:outer membrane translocation and assembly module TamA
LIERLTQLLLCLALLVYTGTQLALHAQQRLEIQSPTPLPSSFSIKKSFPDSASLTRAIDDALLQLQLGGYLAASVDTLEHQDSLWLAKLHLGAIYQWRALQNGNLPESWLRSAGFREVLYRRRTINPEVLQNLSTRLLKAASNVGFPFAAIRLDSFKLHDQQLEARLFVEKGPLILFDSLKVTGDVKISKNYLANYLGLRIGRAYDQSLVLRIRERLRELPFLQSQKDPTVAFTPGRARVNLELQRQRASRFDFLIGVLPNSAQVNRLLITGNFEGEMYNQFGQGERLYARFEQVRPATQRLDFQVGYPYVAGLPLGGDFKFHLYKRDTTFLDVDTDFGIQYLLDGGNYYKVFWNNHSSRLLGINRASLLQNQRLPADLDISQSSFGLEMRRVQLDYRYNPRRGYSVLLRAGAGVKRILKNTKLQELALDYLYDSLQLRTFQYRITGEFSGYLPLGKRSTVKLASTGAWTISNQAIFRNEQLRLGGNKLMRGFDEEIIFASSYLVGTSEYRLLLGQNSYLYAFLDYGWIIDRTSKINQNYRVYGTGAGITFETRAGLFGVSLAYGAKVGASPDLAAPKVHFGYVSLF